MSESAPTSEARTQVHYELPHELDGTSWAVRRNLTEMLHRELIGPALGEDELIETSPRESYLIGRIAPWKLSGSTRRQRADFDTGATPLGALDEGIGDADSASDGRGIPALGADDSTTSSEEDEVDDRPQQRGLMIPASMGLRFQVPSDLEHVVVHTSWARYTPKPSEEVDGKRRSRFQRHPTHHSTTVRLGDLSPEVTTDFALEDEVTLRADRYDDPRTGNVLVEVALCNDLETPQPIPVDAWLYQTQIHVDAGGDAVFLPVRDVLADDDVDDDDEIARLQLQYRNRLEFAIGRTCSADWTVTPEARRATGVRTTWMPETETAQTRPVEVDGAMLDMRQLATATKSEIHSGLAPVLEAYEKWLHERTEEADGLPQNLREIADETLRDAWRVHDQLTGGLNHIATDDEAAECFRFMNRVMADQRIHTQVVERRTTDPALSLSEARGAVLAQEFPPPHSWRTFQLAFIIMQLPALTDPTVARRSADDITSKLELLFFPTGGGKTEAYLGLAAYTFAVRRRQGLLHTQSGELDGRRGVGVLMRYTLRLLTSQQFERATALICAAEMARRDDPETWGSEPFRIGLWVGTAVSPKRFREARDELSDKNAGSGHRLTVLQVHRCPWCGTPISPKNLKSDAATQRIHVFCGDTRGRCPFSEGGTSAEGLPMLTVDEEIYRLVPDFLIATVDKFARLAREGEAASLFGHVNRLCDRHGYVHPDSQACTSERHNATDSLPTARVRPSPALRPPDLIIQDELHLITGALGTTVGLFESAIEAMCTWHTADGRRVAPMIVASTATVRNATDQARNLYARSVTMFPPQVLDVADTFFSREVEVDQNNPGRKYLGISASGERLTRAEVRVTSLLMASSQLLFDRAGDAADPYMTLVGYFNATRELAGMARLVSDDVQTALRRGMPATGLPRRHGSGFGELNVTELTSRVSGSDITDTLNNMQVPFDSKYDTNSGKARVISGEIEDSRSPRPFDAVLATSMLQVGVDVSRLGLMMIVGQPKNTAEYIQASSRVGRSSGKPGLVVSLGNWARPRDLAHFEQFRHYHETFYSQVEALSVTPFSTTSIERGIDGMLVSAARVLQARHAPEGLSPERGAGAFDDHEDFLTDLADQFVRRATRAHSDDAARTMKSRLENRVQSWRQRLREVENQQKSLVYERVNDESHSAPLMMSAENAKSASKARRTVPFVVPNSMREVQNEINLLVSPLVERLYDVPSTNTPTWKFTHSEGN